MLAVNCATGGGATNATSSAATAFPPDNRPAPTNATSAPTRPARLFTACMIVEISRSAYRRRVAVDAHLQNEVRREAGVAAVRGARAEVVGPAGRPRVAGGESGRAGELRALGERRAPRQAIVERGEQCDRAARVPGPERRAAGRAHPAGKADADALAHAGVAARERGGRLHAVALKRNGARVAGRSGPDRARHALADAIVIDRYAVEARRARPSGAPRIPP